METTATSSDITAFANKKIGFLNEEKTDFNLNEKKILGFKVMNVSTWNQFKSVEEYSKVEAELETIFQKVDLFIHFSFIFHSILILYLVYANDFSGDC